MLERNASIYCFLCFIILSNIAYASELINISLSPYEADAGSTTKFYLYLMPTQNISKLEIHFFVDNNKVGTKELFDLSKNINYTTTFDRHFDEGTYIGEHYLELKLNLTTSEKENINKIIYKNINIKNENDFGWIVILIFNLVVFIFIYDVNRKHTTRNIKKFTDNERKTLFGLVITILPIVASYFISIIDISHFKIEILFIFLSFIISYVLIIYEFIEFEDYDPVKANNFTLYSILFLFLGLLDMLLYISLSIIIDRITLYS